MKDTHTCRKTLSPLIAPFAHSWFRIVSSERFLSTYHATVEVPKPASDGYENIPTLVGMADVFINKLGYVWNEKARYSRRSSFSVHLVANNLGHEFNGTYLASQANSKFHVVCVLIVAMHSIPPLRCLCLLCLAVSDLPGKDYIVPKSCKSHLFGPRASSILPTSAERHEKVCDLCKNSLTTTPQGNHFLTNQTNVSSTSVRQQMPYRFSG